MDTILTHAHALVYTLLNLMLTAAQRDNLQVLLGLFWQADGRPLPESSKIKSPGALSRFLNQYQWSTHGVIRAIRPAILDQLLNYQPRGRRPWRQVIIDLTTLEKCGKFKALAHLIHVLQGKRGHPFSYPVFMCGVLALSLGVSGLAGQRASNGIGTRVAVGG